MDDITKTKKSKATSEGSHEWLMERVTGFFSIPLLLWLIWSLVSFGSCGCYASLKDFVSTPINAILLILFLGFFLTYANLAMKVIYEDYVTCNCAKWTLILATKFIAFFTFVAGVFSILNIYFNI